MGQQHCFHAPGADTDFLGWRVNRQGKTEIVYDDCKAQRLVWRADTTGEKSAALLDEALAQAVSAGHERLLPTLFDALKQRSIGIVPLGA